MRKELNKFEISGFVDKSPQFYRCEHDLCAALYINSHILDRFRYYCESGRVETPILLFGSLAEFVQHYSITRQRVFVAGCIVVSVPDDRPAYIARIELHADRIRVLSGDRSALHRISRRPALPRGQLSMPGL